MMVCAFGNPFQSTPTTFPLFMNLFTFTDYSGYNPEITNFMNNGNVVGVNWNGFPNAQTIMLGLNLKF